MGLAAPRLVVLAGVLVIVGAATVASARGEKGVQPTPDRNVLFAHTQSSQAGWFYWMNNAEHDLGHNREASHSVDDAYLANRPDVGDNCDRIPHVGPPDAWTGCNYTPWEFEMDPTLNYTVTLEESGTVEFTVYLASYARELPGPVGVEASFSYGVRGQATVSTNLTFGNRSVAYGAPKQVEVAPCTRAEGESVSCDWSEVTWNVAPNVTELDGTEGNLQWSITLDAATTTNWIAVGSAGANQSRVTLPITSSRPPLTLSAETVQASPAAGAVASYRLTVGNEGSIEYPFALRTVDLPTGYVPVFDTAKDTLASGASTTRQLEVAVPSNATGGTVDFGVELLHEGRLSDRVNLSLDVPESAALSLSPQPATVEVDPGSEVAVDLTLENRGERATDFSVAVDDLPTGYDAEVTPSAGTIGGGASRTLTLTVETSAEATDSTVLKVRVEGTGGTSDVANVDVSVPTVVEGGSAEETVPFPGTPLVAAVVGGAGVLVARRD